MFKYNKKPDGSPMNGPAYGADAASEDWSTISTQPIPESSLGGPDIFGGAEEDDNSFIQIGSDPGDVPETRNVLNYDVTVVGTLKFTDDLLVDGSVEGQITSDGVLTVGSNASIQAGDKDKVAVRTKSAIVQGKVTGDIVVTDRVVLAQGAEVLGDVTADKITIEEGAVFVGFCRVGNPSMMPAAAAPRTSAPRAPQSSDSEANLLG